MSPEFWVICIVFALGPCFALAILFSLQGPWTGLEKGIGVILSCIVWWLLAKYIKNRVKAAL